MTLGRDPTTRPGRQPGWTVDLRRGTVQVLKPGGEPAGTGFLIGDRLLVTCAHVLSSHAVNGDPPSDPVSVRFIPPLDDTPQLARVDPRWWRRTEDADVAFLHLDEAPPADAQVLPLAAAAGTRGHKVRAYGFGGNVPSAGAYGFGFAGDLITGDAEEPLLQLTGCSEVTEGFSGGPVLDDRISLVIGMVSSITDPDPHGRGVGTAYATPTEVLREICPELRVSQICPYWGLEPFTFADSAWFHGRDRVRDTVLASLRLGRRFVALLGPSGSGKSSLIHAGVLPALENGRIPRSDRWGWVSARPGVEPFTQLERAGLPGASAGLVAATRRWLTERPDRERLVLVLDQCEELFTTTPEDPQPGKALFEQLIAVAEQQPAVTVIMVLRDDFYDRMAASAPGLMQLAQQALTNIPGLLEADELHEIIERPAYLAGLTFESDLVERIAEDAAVKAPGVAGGSAAITVLPLLEFALTELWHRRDDGRLTHRAYKQIGGVTGGLTRWCDQAYDSLPSALQPLARRVITSLVRLGEENARIPPTRRRRALTDLRPAGGGSSQDNDLDLDSVINALAVRRMLIISRDPTSDEATVELVHDTLIREWDLLSQWLAKDHDFLTWCQDLESDYKQWKASTGELSGHDPKRLLSGSALEEALRWRRLRGPELPGRFTEFIQLSDDAEQQRRDQDRRRGIRDRRLVRGLTAASILLVAFGIVLVILMVAVDNGRDLALSRQLAANAQDALEFDPELSLLLAREAGKVSASPEAEAALRQATLDSRVRARLRGHQGTVFGVAFSPDGKRIASAGEDRTVRVWDAAGTGNPVVLAGHLNQVLGVAFSPDGKRIASAGEDRTVRVWDAAGTGNPVVLVGHQSAVLGVVFSPDGQRIASAGEDGTVRVWDAGGTGNPVVLAGHQDKVYGVAFSPDGQRVASAGADGTVRVWDAAGASAGVPIVSPGAQGVYTVAFSPDGRRLASAGRDGTVRIWDFSGTSNLLELSGHSDAVLGVTFSPDGRRVASASADGTARIWEAAEASDPIVLAGHQSKVYGVAFSPDGRLASAGKDALVRIWRVSGASDSVVLASHQGAVYGVAFSPDGTRLASAGEDALVRICDVLGRGVPVVLAGHQGTVHDVAFSHDGKRVASASADGTVRVWDASGAGVPVVLAGHHGPVYGVDFSPDGTRVASAGEDGKVRVWDASGADKDNPVVLSTRDSYQVLGVAFNRDGKRLASAGADGKVRIWDASGTDNPVVLKGTQSQARSVAFSPDGTRVTSAGADTNVRIWDDATGTEDPLILAGGHHGTAYSVTFSADGKWIASASADTTVRVWDASGTGNPIVLDDRRAVRAVALSNDGAQVASGGDDGLVRLWTCEVCRQIEEVLRLSEERTTRELTCVEREEFLHEPPCPS